MKAHILTRKTVIKKNIDHVFEFFSKAENLNLITPPMLGFEIINSPEEMKKDALIDYKIRLNGISFNWKTKITKWDPPFYFEDTQIKGPYKLWVHKHKFEEMDRITLMTDIVNFLSPGGIFEFIPHYLIVKKRVESIFDYREKSFKEIFG